MASGSSRDWRRRQKPPRKPPGGSGRAGRTRAAPTAQAPHPGEARRAEVALVWLEPRGEFVRRGAGVMSSRLGAGPAVSFPVWPLCFRGSAVEPAGLAFVPSSPLVLSAPLAGPTPLGQSYLCPFLPTPPLPVPPHLGVSASPPHCHSFLFFLHNPMPPISIVLSFLLPLEPLSRQGFQNGEDEGSGVVTCPRKIGRHTFPKKSPASFGLR